MSYVIGIDVGITLLMAENTRSGFVWRTFMKNPECVRAPDFFARWLAGARGLCVEMMVHPGHLDPTLVGRDGARADAALTRRVGEQRLLSDPAFGDDYRRAGFRLLSPARWLADDTQGGRHAA